MAVRIPPPPVGTEDKSLWNNWYIAVQNAISTLAGSLKWTLLNFTGSNLTHILTKSHQVLDNLQGGSTTERYHLTSARATLVTDIVSTAAEINFNNTSVAGTAVASKTAVLGASKNLDVLNVATLGATTSVAVGGGTALTKVVVFAVAFNPASVAAATTAEQTITVTGITTADKLIISKPSLTAGLGIVNVRAIADGAVVTFINTTGAAIDAVEETYTIVAFRS